MNAVEGSEGTSAFRENYENGSRNSQELLLKDVGEVWLEHVLEATKRPGWKNEGLREREFGEIVCESEVNVD